MCILKFLLRKQLNIHPLGIKKMQPKASRTWRLKIKLLMKVLIHGIKNRTKIMKKISSKADSL